ncbi:MAG: FtsW/RodA/SpoVE family cell cycle protein [Eubacteriales bacterium]|nr:FtsW/RodA/SpoVE family cell cycle protein [Eubacteriales bacterium]
MTTISGFVTTISRWLLVLLAFFILLRAMKSLLTTKMPTEIWAYLSLEGVTAIPLSHWENIIGRASNADIPIDIMTVSRTHGALTRNEDGEWYYSDLQSNSETKLNGRTIRSKVRVRMGDVLTIGGINCTLTPASLEEKEKNKEARTLLTKPFYPWKSLVAISLFQLIVVIQYMMLDTKKDVSSIPIAFGILFIAMWVYSIVLYRLGSRSFEIETIAFFLTTLGIAIAATNSLAKENDSIKIAFTACIGIGLFFFLCWFLRDLNRAMKVRQWLVIASVLLLLFNIVFGNNKYGATNWVSIAGFSVQPSELVKIAYIMVGAGTLDELFRRKSIRLFAVFSLFCLGTLALMGDFGTASIFFVTFLVISFLRSGDISRLVLLVSAAAIGVVMILRFKPYILGRVATWMHAWEFADAGGFQQTRTMSAGASGGLVGLGPGKGWLNSIVASDTDLVFGILLEEFGLIIAIMSVVAIVTLSLFAFKSIRAGRSAFYTICACAATTLLTFQTILNVFGSVDLLPLTGVTFPFVSNGGTAMIASWGLLAFLKASDTRRRASIAVREDEEGF